MDRSLMKTAFEYNLNSFNCKKGVRLNNSRRKPDKYFVSYYLKMIPLPGNKISMAIILMDLDLIIVN